MAGILKMDLVGVQIRHFKSALQCLGKIGACQCAAPPHSTFKRMASHLKVCCASNAGPELLIEALPEKVISASLSPHERNLLQSACRLACALSACS